MIKRVNVSKHWLKYGLSVWSVCLHSYFTSIQQLSISLANFTAQKSLCQSLVTLSTKSALFNNSSGVKRDHCFKQEEGFCFESKQKQRSMNIQYFLSQCFTLK